MRIKKTMAITMAVCLAVGALTGCGEKVGDKVIKIGVFEPTTGENGDDDFQEVLGVRCASKIYPTVKINGEDYEVELAEIDNKSNKIEAVDAAQKLVSRKIGVVLGSYGSGVFIATGQILVDVKVPAIGCSCTNPRVVEGNDYCFRTYFIDLFQDTVITNYAFQDGAKNAAVITQLGDDYSSGLGLFFKDASVKLGGDIVSEEQFQTNQADFKAIPINVKTANPDIIFAPPSITTAPLIIRQARELGITATIAAGDIQENPVIIENAGKDSEGVVLSTFFDEAEPVSDETSSFIKGFKEYLVENKREDIIPAVSALGYDSYLTVVKAIETADSTDTSAIRDALQDAQINDVTGSITFNETDGANKDIAFIKTIKDGKFQLLTTTVVE